MDKLIVLGIVLLLYTSITIDVVVNGIHIIKPQGEFFITIIHPHRSHVYYIGIITVEDLQQKVYSL
jgi:hypothetical protein